MEQYNEIPDEVLEIEAGQLANTSQNSVSNEYTNTILFACSSIILIVVFALILIKLTRRKGRRAKSMSMLKQELNRNEQKEKEKKEKEKRRLEENKVKRPLGIPEDAVINLQKNEKIKQKGKNTRKKSESLDPFETDLLDAAISTEIDDSLFGIYEDELYKNDEDIEEKEYNTNENVNDFFVEELFDENNFTEYGEKLDVIKNEEENDLFTKSEDCSSENKQTSLEVVNNAEKEEIKIETPKIIETQKENISLHKQDNDYTDVKEEKSFAVSELSNVKKECNEEHVVNYVDNYISDSNSETLRDISINDSEEALKTLDACKGGYTIVNKVNVNDVEEELPVNVCKGSKVTVTFRTKFDFDFKANIELNKINCKGLEIIPKLVLTEDGKKKMIEISFYAPENLRMENIHAKIETDMSNIAKGNVTLITHLVIAV